MNKNSRKRIEARRESARVRQQERSKRDNTSQVNILIKRGHGHCKEVTRLTKLSKEDQLKFVDTIVGEK
jgi:hypothetical protein